ncbi:cation diffusion facilitator family transporter [Roseibacillus ishigakijimensis]|uniref:Cation transporter n=1 Tax=Roseibacillus ishigakijimensis TaxID=454146 RepID=A0A934RTP5_9BACT|nr:cation diffusion facilitator family transporter [Roseibacillus ishigakijimensis]MBK1834321.1 cation transporter [Roseibacillus ishigakijimensis]
MSHHHHHHSSQNLGTAFLLNFVFTIIEVIGGLLTNSVAILSDAIHDFGDSLSLALAWYFEKRSRQGPNARQSYGAARYRLLGGLITGLVLVIGLSIVLWQASQRLLNPEPVHTTGMILLALLGIALNGLAVLKVRGGTSLTEKVVSWHLLEDVLGWVAVLLGAIAMKIWHLPLIDPLLSIGISLFVLWNVARNLRQIGRVFLQSVPESFDLERFDREACSFPKVQSTHHAHVWSLDGENHVLSIHLVMTADSERADIVRAKQGLRALLPAEGFTHVTIEVELVGEDCSPKENTSQE